MKWASAVTLVSLLQSDGERAGEKAREREGERENA